MKIPNYKIIRSERRTIGLSMTKEGLVVRAPYRASVRSIEKVIVKNQSWIAKATLRRQETEQLAAEKEI